MMQNLLEFFEHLRPGHVTVLGVPYDENSSFMHGPASAPARIREVLNAGSANLCSESEIDLSIEPRFHDLGDLDLLSGTTLFEQSEKAITDLLEREVYVLSLGGDHSITYPVLKAYGKKHKKLDILHLDAHPDLYDEFEDNRFSNACPFARIMEENLAARLVQIGIRTMNPHQRAQAERFGVEVIEMKKWHPDIPLGFEGPVYLSLDMDVLDPAFAPGVSHHEPGGLSARDVLQIIQGIRAPIVGADIVEFNPKRDPSGITAMAAAKFLKEIAAHMIETTVALKP
ncbi:MAG: agmatinase [Desulfobacteraceae bacterium]|nr:MAG: agmatinase [Desulfobacteraceae bacterium]